MSKQQITESQIKEKIKNLTPDEKEFLETAYIADQVYNEVVSYLDIPEDDHVYHSLVVAMLKRQTKDHLIYSIWNNLSDKEALHLRDFISQMSKTTPWLEVDDVVLEFAQAYPDLKEKVYESLTNFFIKFVEKFNNLRTF